MEKAVFSTVFNRQNYLTKKGTATVEACVYMHGKRKYFNTGVSLKPEQWDNKKKRVKPTANIILMTLLINTLIGS